MFKQLTSTEFTQLYSDCPLTFGLDFWDDDALSWKSYDSAVHLFVQSWNIATQNYADYGVTNRGTGELYLTGTGM